MSGNGRKEFHVVNHSVPRGDGIPKVTGMAMYVSDMVVDHMAWAKVLRSPYAHARIVSIDASEAEKHPGVVAVLTGYDLKNRHPYYGHAVKDHSMPQEAIDKLDGALKSWGGRYESEVYPDAMHGWTVADSAAYNKPQAERAFGKLTALFAAELK